MEYCLKEERIIEDAALVATQNQLEELSNLELAFVGGGIGDVVVN